MDSSGGVWEGKESDGRKWKSPGLLVAEGEEGVERSDLGEKEREENRKWN